MEKRRTIIQNNMSKTKRPGKEAIWLNEVRSRKLELESLISEKEEAIKRAPDGHLRVLAKKNYVQYYWIKEPGDTNGKFIPIKKNSIAEKLAQKDYEQKAVKLMQKEFNALSKYLDCLEESCISEVYDNLSDQRKVIVAPIIPPDEDYVRQWLTNTCKPMGFEADSAEYYSDNGVRVRSKSEIIIANMLEKQGIPYKYEQALSLGRFGSVRPDFTCLNVRTRTEYIWEHFGMMDDEDYSNKNIAKINAYEDNGFHAGNNLIMTFETSKYPINSSIIKTMIQTYLL